MQSSNIICKTPARDIEDNLGGIGTVLFGYMKKYSNRIALIESETDKSETFESLLQKCIKIALHLKKIGIKKGDVICISAEMSIFSYAAVLAAYFIGGVIYCLEPSLPAAESAMFVNRLPPTLFIVTEAAEHFLTAVVRQTNISAKSIVVNQAFIDQCDTEQANIDQFIPEYIEDPAETICIFSSSGSTGPPKLVQLNHYYLYCLIADISGSWTKAALNLKDLKDPVLLDCTNWHWGTSLYILLTSTSGGATRILAQSLDGPKIWNYIKKYKVTNVFIAPYHCIEFYHAKPENPKTYLTSLREILTGGSRLADKYITLINNLLQPEYYLRRAYAVTETGLLATSDPFDEKHRQYIQQCPKSVGCPLPGFLYKVVDVDSEKILGPNQIGELRVRPFSKRALFNGYVGIKNNDEFFDSDGWFKTEDLVYYDENQCFYVVDRLKARVKYQNWLIYPIMVESILLQHPQVLNPVVIGIDDPEDGEILMAVVTLKDNNDIFEDLERKVALENEIRQFVDERVEDYQKLRKGVKIVRKIPLTITNKINRPKTKQLVMAGEEF